MLADGAFRLIIAVDRITVELRGIVEYLNTRTDERVKVLALEVDLITHEGVEVLIPSVHGMESSRLKAQRGEGARRGFWDVEPVLSAFDEAFDRTVRARIQDFLEDLRSAGGYLQRGTGANPALSGVLRTPNGVRTLWSLTLDEGPLGGPQFFFNVNTWLGVFGAARVDGLLNTFAQDAALAPVTKSVRERGAEKLHRVRITDVFESEAAAQVLRSELGLAMIRAEG